MYKDKKIAVVVPAWNEEQHIGKVLEGMPEFVDVVYVVDDASTDRTADIVRGYVADPVGAGSRACLELGGEVMSRIQLITHEKNSGVGAAIVTGYKRALADGMDIAAVMAGDNQMDPALLPTMLDPVVEGRADYSKGTRMTVSGYRGRMTRWRAFGNWLLRWLTAVASGNMSVTDPQNGYTAASRLALESVDLNSLYAYYGYCNDLITRLTARHLTIIEVPTPQVINQGQRSKIRYHCYIAKVSGLLVRCLMWRARDTVRVLSGPSRPMQKRDG